VIRGKGFLVILCQTGDVEDRLAGLTALEMSPDEYGELRPDLRGLRMKMI